LVIKTLDPDRIGFQRKMLDPDPDQMNADLHPWFKVLEEKLLEARRSELLAKESRKRLKEKPREFRSVYMFFLVQRLAALKGTVACDGFFDHIIVSKI
jgi:hypothetical protein